MEDSNLEKYGHKVLLHAEIGKFVVAFESLINSARQHVYLLINPDNLSHDFVDVFFADLEAFNVQKKYVGIISTVLDSRIKDYRSENPDVTDKMIADFNSIKFYEKDELFPHFDLFYFLKMKNQVSYIGNCIIKVGEVRNKLLHSTWYLMESETQMPELSSHKHSLSKSGIDNHELKLEPNKFNDIIDDMNRLSDFMRYLIVDILLNANGIYHKVLYTKNTHTTIDFEKYNKLLFESKI